MKLRKALIIASLLAAGTLTGLTQASAQDDGSGRSGKELRKAQRAASERLDRFPRIAEFLKAHPGIAKKLREFKAKRGEAEGEERYGRRGRQGREARPERDEGPGREDRPGRDVRRPRQATRRPDGAARPARRSCRGASRSRPGTARPGTTQSETARPGTAWPETAWPASDAARDDACRTIASSASGAGAQEHPIKARMLKKGIENRRQGDARISRKDTNRAQRGREGSWKSAPGAFHGARDRSGAKAGSSGTGTAKVRRAQVASRR